MEFDDPQGAVYIQMAVNPDTTVSRQLCLAPNVGLLLDQPFVYNYAANHQWGRGVLFVSNHALFVEASPGQAFISPGDQVQLRADTLGGFPPYRYQWTASPADPSISNPTIVNPTANPVANTTYTVTVTDSDGFTATASAKVSLILAVTASATPFTSPGQLVQLNAAVSGGVAPYTFAWSGAVSNPSISNPTANPTGMTTYTVLVTDAAGTQATASVTVAIQLTMTVTATPSTVSPGQLVQLNAVASGGTPPYSFSWASGPVSNAGISNPTTNPVNTSTYTVFVSDAPFNSAIASVTVTVKLVLGLTPPSGQVSYDPACIGSSCGVPLGVAVAGGTPPYQFVWNPTGSLNLQNRPDNPIATPSVTTPYTVTVTDQKGLTATGFFTVKAVLHAFAKASPATINSGSTSELISTVIGGSPPYTYAWNPSLACSGSACAGPIQVSPATTTTYMLTVTDSAGDQSTAQATVNVNPVSPGPEACLTISWPAAGQGQVDASCSKPADSNTPIIRYEFTFLFDPNNPAQDCSQPGNQFTCYDLCQSPTTSPVITNCNQIDPAAISPLFFPTPGDLVRVRVVDALGAAAVQTANVPPPPPPPQ
jgi:hypothetical protein